MYASARTTTPPPSPPPEVLFRSRSFRRGVATADWFISTGQSHLTIAAPPQTGGSTLARHLTDLFSGSLPLSIHRVYQPIRSADIHLRPLAPDEVSDLVRWCKLHDLLDRSQRWTSAKLMSLHRRTGGCIGALIRQLSVQQDESPPLNSHRRRAA